MRNYHDSDGVGLPNYPIDLEVVDSNVYIHSCGMIAVHDYGCPVCGVHHAVIDIGTGIMHPCRRCEKTYKLVRVDDRDWLLKIKDWLTGRDSRGRNTGNIE